MTIYDTFSQILPRPHYLANTFFSGSSRITVPEIPEFLQNPGQVTSRLSPNNLPINSLKTPFIGPLKPSIQDFSPIAQTTPSSLLNQSPGIGRLENTGPLLPKQVQNGGVVVKSLPSRQLLTGFIQNQQLQQRTPSLRLPVLSPRFLQLNQKYWPWYRG